MKFAAGFQYIDSTSLFCEIIADYREKIGEVYEAAYGKEQFVRVLPAKRCADTKYVFMTNCCEIGYNCDARTKKIIVTSCIDNLTKGASGQAIQCMNIRFGLDEAAGLL